MRKLRFDVRILVPAAAVAVLIIGILIVLFATVGDKEKEAIKISEEQAERLETQAGVAVNEEGTMEIDMGAVEEAESAAAISREEAESSVKDSLGKGTEIGSAGLREYEGKDYWVIYAEKGKKRYQVWIDAETGEEFLRQQEQ